MPRQTRTAVIADLNASIDEELPTRLLYALLASATNPDETPFTLPVDAALAAGSLVENRPRGLTPRGYLQPVVPGNAAAAALLAPPANATRATLVPSVAIRWRDDGTAPTATVGMPLAAGATLEYTGTPATFRFLAQAAGAGVLDASFYSVA